MTDHSLAATLPLGGLTAGEVAARLRAGGGEVLAALGLSTPQRERREAGRTEHSMELGRDLPGSCPYVDAQREELSGEGSSWVVRCDVARWNPDEVARSFVSGRAEGPAGLLLRVYGGEEGTDRLQAVEVRGEAPLSPARFAAVLEALRARLS